RPSRKRIGHGLFDDLLQRHAASSPQTTSTYTNKIKAPPIRNNGLSACNIHAPTPRRASGQHATMKLRKNLRTLFTPRHFPDPSGRRRPHHPVPSVPASLRRPPSPPPTEGGGQGLVPRPGARSLRTVRQPTRRCGRDRSASGAL